MSKVKTCSLRDEPYPHRHKVVVQDATEPLIWEQLPEDRMGAVQMHENHCQIAEAIKRSHPEIDQVWVKASRIAARYKDGSYVKWEMSNRLKGLLRTFDTGGKIPDGKYRANVIQKGHRQDDLTKEYERIKQRRATAGPTPPRVKERKVLTTR